MAETNIVVVERSGFFGLGQEDDWEWWGEEEGDVAEESNGSGSTTTSTQGAAATDWKKIALWGGLGVATIWLLTRLMR